MELYVLVILCLSTAGGAIGLLDAKSKKEVLVIVVFMLAYILAIAFQLFKIATP